MCNAHVVVTVSAAANAFAATLDRFSCRDGCLLANTFGVSAAAPLRFRFSSGLLAFDNSLPRKRDHEPPPKCHWKILRTRNGGGSIIADVSGDENRHSSENDG